MTDLPKAPGLPPKQLDEEIRGVVQKIPNEPREYRFTAIGDQVVEAILETAKQQLHKAEENFKMAERAAEELKARIKNIWEILQEAEKELQEYGNYTIEMSEKITRKKGNSSGSKPWVPSADR